MKNNVFQFGDSFWLQLSGTAMGTPPAPPYATIYVCIWEMQIMSEFKEISFYKRYIDDGQGIWNKLSEDDDERWNLFKERVNMFGTNHTFFISNPHHKPLQWTFSERSNNAIFLDLSLKIENGQISSTIYEKPMNLYLYIPPHSCHAPGVVKGLIYGIVYRTKVL